MWLPPRRLRFGSCADEFYGCFAETVHIVPASDKRLVPDLYHIVLHILILANLVACVV